MTNPAEDICSDFTEGCIYTIKEYLKSEVKEDG